MDRKQEYLREKKALFNQTIKQVAWLNSRQCWRCPETELAIIETWEQYHVKKSQLREKYRLPPIRKVR